MIARRSLSRRTLLRGMGVSIALPFLDAMVPALATAARTSALKPPCRMLFNYVPNGIIMKDWTPANVGALAELPRILQPMAPFGDRMLLISGMQQHFGWPNNDGPGDHARAASTYLTGVHAKKTPGADIEVGISVDQVAAQHIGSQTRIPSLELSCEDGRVVGVCDSGYTCVYSNNISWRSATTPSSPEVNPRAVFERLFGPGDEDPATRMKMRRYDRSILDGALDDTRRLEGSLGPSDRRKLDEYVTAVRDIEARIQRAEKEKQQIVPTMDKPDAAPAELADEARLMYDLLHAAFKTDSTRIATLMIGREGSLRTYREIEIPDSHHPLTHHKGNEEMIEKVYRINRLHMELFAEFVSKLAKTPEGDGTLLDHAMIVYGGGLADGNRHQHDQLPLLMVGGANGTITTGRHIQFAEERPLNNLYVSLLSRMGLQVENLGDSTGIVKELSEIA